MKTINYISNLGLNEVSGGMSGINFAIHKQLKRYFKINYLGPINPKSNFLEKGKSKLGRLITGKGNYHFFSEKRLKKIARIVHRKIRNYADADYYHGFTPWIKIKKDRPYFAYNDACFASYVNIYNNPKKFIRSDLVRIFNQEKKWLEQANGIFFGTKWAMEETKKYYQLSGSNFSVVGLGGFIDLPSKKIPQNKKPNFLFISKEFIAKGGFLTINAFRKLQQEYPQIKLHIVGEKPSKEILNNIQIIYHGFLDKANREDKQKTIHLLEEGFVLLHPTKKDIAPLTILEAGYYGIPAITSASFAIPEMISDMKTGILLREMRADNLYKKMKLLVENENLYGSLSKSIQKKTIKLWNWPSVGKQISQTIMSRT